MRRRDLNAALLLAPLGRPALAQAPSSAPWPNRPVRIVVAFPAGGGTDIIARETSQRVAAATGWTFVIDNKPGANGMLGSTQVAKSPADGYTVYAVHDYIHLTFYAGISDVKYSDFDPICLVAATPSVLTASAKTPWKNWQELADDAKKRPNEIIFSSSGLYGALHLPTVLFMKAAGIKMKHLPTNGGGPALTAILGNNAQVLVSSIAAASAQVKAGKLRALASFGAKRAAAMPDVPTLKESGIDVEFSLWVGVFAPKGTPPAVTKVLGDTIKKASETEQFKTAIKNLGDEVAYLDQAGFAKFWDEDAKRVEAAVQSIGRVQG